MINIYLKIHIQWYNMTLKSKNEWYQVYFEIKCNISTDYKMLFWHAFCSSSLFHSCTKNYWQQTPNHVRLWKIGILSTIILNNLGEFAYRTPFLKVTKSLNVNSATHKWIFEYFFSRKESKDHPETFFTNGYVITDDNIFDEIKKN